MKTMRMMALAVCAAALAGPVAAEPFRLIVTDMEAPLVPNSVMDLALQEGYFERAGVEVELVRVQQTPMAMAALRSGEGEMANVAVESMLQSVAQGAEDLRAVMSPNKSLPFLIAAQGGIASAGDLEGKRFGVGRIGSLDHTLSMQVLESAGVDTASLQIVALGQPSVRAQALLADQIDATTMSIGVFTALEAQAAGSAQVLVDVDAYYRAAPVVSKVNAVTAETLASRGPEVEAVIEALTLAARDFAADPQLWVAAMQKARPDVAEADLQKLGAAFAGSWSVNGGLQREELEFSADWLYASEDFKGVTPAPVEAWTEFGPVEAVLARIGTTDGSDALTR